MPSRIIDGVRYVMTRHIWGCKLCGVIVESKARHDFRSCSCGNLSVDGGITDSASVSYRKKDEVEDLCVWKPA
jgi:hypothetical protein